MVDSTLPDSLRGRTVPDSRFRDTRRASEWADPSAFDFWPGLPRCVSRALPLIILLAMLPGILAAFSRGAHARPGEVLLANAGQPPSVRLVMSSAPDAFGVRVGDTVIVTETGTEIATESPKDLVVLRVQPDAGSARHPIAASTGH